MFDLVKNNILAELRLFGWYSRPWSVLFSSPLVKLTLKSQNMQKFWHVQTQYIPMQNGGFRILKIKKI